MNESETPLTEAALIDNADLYDSGTGKSEIVHADFARRLELRNRRLVQDITVNWVDLITKACLAYHQRRLDGCGGDVLQLLIRVHQVGAKEGVELLQLHTAKAMEEATRLLKEQIRVSDVAFQGEFDRHRATEKERDDLRTQRDYWDARCKDAESHFDGLRLRAEKAEAEVAELKGSCALLERMEQAVSDQLTQLQQDVRPLVDYLTEFADRQDGAPDASPIDKEACNASAVLETFLAKHPALK